MEIKHLYLIIFIAQFIINVMSLNPLLTYTLRFKTISAQPNITSNLTINQYKEIQLINGHIQINSNEPINKIVTVFYRCEPDGINCEYFQSWEFTDICQKLLEKNQVWSRWYESFHPPMVCPITNKINYRVINATYDIGPVLFWYSNAVDYQWKVTKKFYSGDIFVGSFMISASVFGYRKRRLNKTNHRTAV